MQSKSTAALVLDVFILAMLCTALGGCTWRGTATSEVHVDQAAAGVAAGLQDGDG